MKPRKTEESQMTIDPSKKLEPFPHMGAYAYAQRLIDSTHEDVMSRLEQLCQFVMTNVKNFEKAGVHCTESVDPLIGLIWEMNNDRDCWATCDRICVVDDQPARLYFTLYDELDGSEHFYDIFAEPVLNQFLWDKVVDDTQAAINSSIKSSVNWDRVFGNIANGNVPVSEDKA